MTTPKALLAAALLALALPATAAMQIETYSPAHYSPSRGADEPYNHAEMVFTTTGNRAYWLSFICEPDGKPSVYSISQAFMMKFDGKDLGYAPAGPVFQEGNGHVSKDMASIHGLMTWACKNQPVTAHFR